MRTNDELDAGAPSVLDEEELRVWKALNLPGLEDVLFDVTARVRSGKDMRAAYPGNGPAERAERDLRSENASRALAANTRLMSLGVLRAVFARLIDARLDIASLNSSQN